MQLRKTEVPYGPLALTLLYSVLAAAAYDIIFSNSNMPRFVAGESSGMDFFKVQPSLIN